MKQRQSVMVVLASLTILSCATTMVQSGGFSLKKSALDLDFDFVRNRSSFDLSCPKDKIDLVVLNTQAPTFPDLAMEIGATGCRKRAVYVARPGGWVLNSPITEVAEPSSSAGTP